MRINPRPDTLAAKLCQEDPDLKCPEHDRMSFLLADDRVWVMLLASANAIPDGTQFSARDIRLEVPVVKGIGEYSTIVGFADASCMIEQIRFTNTPYRHGWKTSSRGGRDSGMPIEWFDFRPFFVEAKPRIDNPMEVLRQLNTYRKFAAGSFLVWCPTIDTRTQAVFTSQGILVSTLSVEYLETTIQELDANPAAQQ